MAGGWSRDGAEHEQMDATVNDALERARRALPTGESAEFCDECGNPIPEARRIAVPGVQHCVSCQSELEKEAKLRSCLIAVVVKTVSYANKK